MSRFSKLEFQEDLPLEHLEAAPEALPQGEAYHLQWASSWCVRGDFEGALREYAKALEHNPKNPLPWTGQVRMLIELGEYREAKLWADKALEMFPHEPELLAAKAVALARMGDHKAAIAFSDASFAGRGESAYLWTARADVLLAQEQPRADYCLERAVTLDPGNWIVHWLISRINFHYGRFVQALAAAQKALAQDANRVQLWVQAALCQQQLGLHAAAAESGQHALRLAPWHPHALAVMAELDTTPPFFAWMRRFRQIFRK